MNLLVPLKTGNFLTDRMTTGVSGRIILHGINYSCFEDVKFISCTEDTSESE